MWQDKYEDRLKDWINLRAEGETLELGEYLTKVNTWWYRSPWAPYTLHIDDHRTWPTPWELLEDTRFCPLARALGIMYTLVLTDRSDTGDAILINTVSDSIVQVGGGIYTLNYHPDQVVNIRLPDETRRKEVSLRDISLLMS